MINIRSRENLFFFKIACLSLNAKSIYTKDKTRYKRKNDEEIKDEA